MKAVLAWFAAPAATPAAPGADVDARYRRYRLQLMLAITLGYGVSYTGRLVLGVVKQPMIDAGVLTAADLGTIGSALFYTYAFGKLFSGVAADHLHVGRVMAAAFAGSAVLNLTMAAVAGSPGGVMAASVIWGANGLMQSFGAPACVVALTAWFSNRERGRVYGVWSMAHSIGEGLTFLLIGGVVAALGWRAGFLAPTLVLLAGAALTLAWVRGTPQSRGLPPVAAWRGEASPAAGAARAEEGGPVLASQLGILKRPAVWILALASAAAYVSRYAIASWGVLYLQEARGFSLPGAAGMLFASTVAGAAGSVAYGFLSDTVFGARRPPANLIFGLAEIGGLLLIFFGPGNVWSLGAGMVLFGLGMTGLVTALGGLFATDICPKRAAGAVMGMIGVFSYLGAAIQEQVSGALVQAGTTMVSGQRHYDFGPAILFWIGASVVSLLLAGTLWRVKASD
jgi:OPA family sugar phosphate sensor protein UhpC-like MFS transporter